jgi:hypothetical protein
MALDSVSLISSKEPKPPRGSNRAGASTRQEKGCKKQPRRENGKMEISENG